METNLALVDAFQGFMATARPYVIITDEEDYNKALEALEQILESAEDTENSPLNPLIDMLTHAIEKYETKDSELSSFLAEAEELPVDIALLRALMSQYQLTGADLPEIGCKSMVSKVLKGERLLNRTAIEQLSKRFGLRPALFFGEPSV
jgi:HTH-type transcriptional regulator / antitoxin HigA